MLATNTYFFLGTRNHITTIFFTDLCKFHLSHRTRVYHLESTPSQGGKSIGNPYIIDAQHRSPPLDFLLSLYSIPLRVQDIRIMIQQGLPRNRSEEYPLIGMKKSVHKDGFFFIAWVDLNIVSGGCSNLSPFCLFPLHALLIPDLEHIVAFPDQAGWTWFTCACRLRYSGEAAYWRSSFRRRTVIGWLESNSRRLPSR